MHLYTQFPDCHLSGRVMPAWDTPDKFRFSTGSLAKYRPSLSGAVKTLSLEAAARKHSVTSQGSCGEMVICALGRGVARACWERTDSSRARS